VKKVKITLRPGSPGKKFYLFPSSEALYMWLCTVERGETIQIPDIEELLLEPGGFIEAELRGFEYAYEGNNKFRRLELIRLGKTQATSNASGILVSTHRGWVSGGLLPMKHYSDVDIDARVLHEGESKLDLASLFGDDPPLEDDSVDIEVEEEDPSDDGDGT
jgi:hypothetical protein